MVTWVVWLKALPRAVFGTPLELPKIALCRASKYFIQLPAVQFVLRATATAVESWWSHICWSQYNLRKPTSQFWSIAPSSTYIFAFLQCILCLYDVTCWVGAMPRPVLERPWCCIGSPSTGLKYFRQLPVVFFTTTTTIASKVKSLKWLWDNRQAQ